MYKDMPVYISLVFAAAVLGYVTGIERQADYTQGLEKILAKCLDDRYHLITIGDEHFMCGVNKL